MVREWETPGKERTPWERELDLEYHEVLAREWGETPGGEKTPWERELEPEELAKEWETPGEQLILGEQDPQEALPLMIHILCIYYLIIIIILPLSRGCRHL